MKSKYPILNEGQDFIDADAGASKEQILSQCQMSRGELMSVLTSDQRLRLSIVEISFDRYAYFNHLSLYELVD
jgi:hypothetical protein